MIYLNMVNYTILTMTWDTFLLIRGTQGWYLNHVLPLRSSNNCRVGGWLWPIRFKRQTRVQISISLFDLTLGDFGLALWTGTWTQACQYDIMICMHNTHYVNNLSQGETKNDLK